MAEVNPPVQGNLTKDITDQIAENSDGFTTNETQIATGARAQPWIPPGYYEDLDIKDLVPGPRPVLFMGRIVNLYEQQTPSKKSNAASGFIKLTIKDDTGTIVVKLWFMSICYKLVLGQLCTVWTQHISNGPFSKIGVPSGLAMVNIFPGRDSTCHFMTHQQKRYQDVCRLPIDCEDKKPLRRLFNLKTYVNGAHEIENSRVLVIVKNLGIKKTVKASNGTSYTVLEVGIFDDSESATVTLFRGIADSAMNWIPFHTVLLLTNLPSSTCGTHKYLRIRSTSLIEVDPSFPYVEWLRLYALKSGKEARINPPFPSSLFDFNTTLTAPARTLFTIADIEDFRSAPNESFTGFLSLIVQPLNLVSLYQKSMLCSGEHCGNPLFSRFPSASCASCKSVVTLCYNPSIINSVLDETGSLLSNSIILSSKAWVDLLGVDAAQMAETDLPKVKYIEQRIAWLRITAVFGWAANSEDVRSRVLIGRVG